MAGIQITTAPTLSNGEYVTNRKCSCEAGKTGANCELLISAEVDLAVERKAARGWCEAPQGSRSSPPWTGDCYTVNYSTESKCNSVHTGINIQNMSGCKEENGAWAPYFQSKGHCETAMAVINAKLGSTKFEVCQRYVGGEGWTPTRRTELDRPFIQDVLTRLNAL